MTSFLLEELLTPISKLQLIPIVTTAATTTLHLGVTSELFELENWDCTQIKALFKQITKHI